MLLVPRIIKAAGVSVAALDNSDMCKRGIIAGVPVFTGYVHAS